MFNGPDSINGGDYEEESVSFAFIVLLHLVLALNGWTLRREAAKRGR